MYYLIKVICYGRKLRRDKYLPAHGTVTPAISLWHSQGLP